MSGNITMTPSVIEKGDKGAQHKYTTFQFTLPDILILGYWQQIVACALLRKQPP